MVKAINKCCSKDLQTVVDVYCKFWVEEHWKFLSRGKRLGKYYFSHAEYDIARIEYERNWGIKPSRFDRILVSLSSEFQSRDELREAESIIEEKIRRFIETYGRAVKPC